MNELERLNAEFLRWLHTVDKRWFIPVGALVLAFGAVIYLATKQEHVDAVAVSMPWSRSEVIQEYMWTAGRSIAGFPAGSRSGYTKYEVIGHHTKYWTTSSTSMVSKRERSGQSCSTSGYGSSAKRRCTDQYTYVTRPVTTVTNHSRRVADWGTAYYYEVQRWNDHREVRSAGDKALNAAVAWPDPKLSADPPERVGARSERYEVFFRTRDAKPYHAAMTMAQWDELKPGIEYTLTINGFGAIVGMRPADSNGVEVRLN